MPELPEVETIRLGMIPAIRNKRIAAVTVHRHDLRMHIPRNFAQGLKGETVTSLLRRGKYILAFTKSGTGFVLHLGMSGRLRIYGPGDFKAKERQKHDHVLWRMEDNSALVFHDPRRFGMIIPMTRAGWQSQSPFDRMGPEPLSDDFTGPALAQALARRNGPIKTALLDQTVVAGIGNIYACEALYQAGIHPSARASSLRPKETARLAAALKDVLTRALAAGGSTLRDYRDASGERGYFQHHFSVYDRAGQTCPDCTCRPASGGIVRIVQAGRSTFYCPARQKTGAP